MCCTAELQYSYGVPEPDARGSFLTTPQASHPWNFRQSQICGPLMCCTAESQTFLQSTNPVTSQKTCAGKFVVIHNTFQHSMGPTCV